MVNDDQSFSIWPALGGDIKFYWPVDKTSHTGSVANINEENIFHID